MASRFKSESPGILFTEKYYDLRILNNLFILSMNTSVWDFHSASLRLFTQIFKLYVCETYFLNRSVLGQGTGCLVLII